MKYISLLLLCMTFVSCTKKPKCELTERYSHTAAAPIASFFECKKPEAIAKDLQKTIEKLKMCEDPVATGMLSSVICTPVSKFVADLLVKEGLPKAWECSGGSGAAAVQLAIYSACTAIPF